VDLAHSDAVPAYFAQIAAQFGRFDALVNSEGIDCQSPVATMVLTDWTRMIAVNVGSVFLTAKHGIPPLEWGENPAIVNMSSIFGHVAGVDYLA
jgi:NAD(P)-dependent dehydrogenase (short-subunit alcohol dehydrogenase family)